MRFSSQTGAISEPTDLTHISGFIWETCWLESLAFVCVNPLRCTNPIRRKMETAQGRPNSMWPPYFKRDLFLAVVTPACSVSKNSRDTYRSASFSESLDIRPNVDAKLSYQKRTITSLDSNLLHCWSLSHGEFSLNFRTICWHWAWLLWPFLW